MDDHRGKNAHQAKARWLLKKEKKRKQAGYEGHQE